jgi:predicted nucleic acid binding AN1-type Zn finger protein
LTSNSVPVRIKKITWALAFHEKRTPSSGISSKCNPRSAFSEHKQGTNQKHDFNGLVRWAAPYRLASNLTTVCACVYPWLNFLGGIRVLSFGG